MRCMVIYLVGLQFSELGAEINKPCSHNAGASFVQIQHCWSHSILKEVENFFVEVLITNSPT